MMLGVGTSPVLQVSAAALGAVAGVVAVALARTVPSRMGVANRQRSTVWWAIAVAVGAAYGYLAASTSGWSLLPAFVAFGGVTLALALIDLDHQLIPNRVLFPGLGLAGSLLAIGALVEGSQRDLLRGALGAVFYFVFLLVVALIARGGFGMGDVKLAILLGLFLGFLSWEALAVGFITAILLGGVGSILILVLTRRGTGTKFAYGPFLVAGSWLGVLWGSEIANWYLR